MMKRVHYIVALVFLSAIFCWNRLAEGASAFTPWGPMTQIEAAAKKEGKLVVYAAPGHTSQDSERAMSQILKDKYGLSVDWISVGAKDIAPRILTEQRTQQYVSDLVMT